MDIKYNIVNAAGEKLTWYRDFKMAKACVAANPGTKAVKVVNAPVALAPKVKHVLVMADGSEVELTKSNVAAALRGE